ncbi:Uncharacterized protein Adt_34837 [Abeliophyllum distichum]|uniref:Uncharacterized protein n=1 Tax=Abeliophyllum distichum TaxID=126358 RepID=A0ABD1R2G1_9LAMI
MQRNFQFISQLLISDPTFLFNSNGNMIPLSLSLQHPLFSPYCCYKCHSQKTRIQNTILCSRNKRRRYGSERSTKLVLESACIIASNIGLLPEPLELLLRELGGGNRGGNGGGFGSWNGFGWGVFNGSKKRRKSKLGILGILVILGVGLWNAEMFDGPSRPSENLRGLRQVYEIFMNLEGPHWACKALARLELA